jgi:hypothetical protein
MCLPGADGARQTQLNLKIMMPADGNSAANTTDGRLWHVPDLWAELGQAMLALWDDMGCRSAKYNGIQRRSAS